MAKQKRPVNPHALECVARLKLICAQTSPAEFLSEMARLIDGAIIGIRQHVEGHEDAFTYYPHRLPLATWQQVQSQLFEVAKIVRAATVIPAPAGMAAARSDDAFQRFLTEQCIPGLEP